MKSNLYHIIFTDGEFVMGQAENIMQATFRAIEMANRLAYQSSTDKDGFRPINENHIASVRQIGLDKIGVSDGQL